MAFKDLDELLDDTLPLPIKGKVYRVPGVDAEWGLICQRMLSAGVQAFHAAGTPDKPVPGAPVIEDGNEQDFYRRCLGPVYDELRADGISWEKIKFCGTTAFLWIAQGAELAEQYWNSGGDPEASAPNRQQRRSTGTDGATTTRQPNSTSGTRSRRRPRRR